MIPRCVSCNSEVPKMYCPDCGERVLDKESLTLRSLFRQFMEGVFNIDNKLIRTLRSLLLQPGQLTVEYAGGRRIPYMRPFQLFVLVNLIFFITLTDADLFRAPAKWYFSNNPVDERVDRILEIQDMTLEELTILYDQTSSDWAKGLILVLIPVIGFFLALFFRGRPVGLHMVFATHFLSFFLAYLLLLALFLFPFMPVHRFVLQGGIVFGVFTYHLFALRRVYDIRGFRVLGLSFVFTVFIVALIISYRAGISAFSLWQLS